MPQYFQRLLLFHLRHILKRPKALEAISKLPPCNEDASNVKESLVHMNLSPNQQLVFGSFAARQKSAQPAIDACKTAICHHPHLSFSGCFYATDRSIQYRLSTTFRQADHCRIPYQLWCGQDFSAADHHLFSAQQSSPWWVPVVLFHSARPNRDEHRDRDSLTIDDHHPLCPLSAFGFSNAWASFLAQAKLPAAKVSAQSNWPC